MATVVLEAQSRGSVGTSAANTERKKGFVPGVVYGDNQAPESISISRALLNKYVNKSNFFSTVFELSGIGKKGQKFVAKDVQFHPVTDNAVHVDFMRVGKGAKVTVRVPLAFVNEQNSPGLKLGGVLNVLVHEVDVVCDTDHIPDQIEVDLTGLEFHHTVHALDLKLDKDVELPRGIKNFTIATVVAPTLMKASEETATETAATTEAAADTSTEASK